MKVDKDTMRLMQLTAALKRRGIFVSLVMTRTETQVSWWDERRGAVVTDRPEFAQMHLNVLEENDRQELERVGRRMGGAYDGRRADAGKDSRAGRRIVFQGL